MARKYDLIRLQEIRNILSTATEKKAVLQVRRITLVSLVKLVEERDRLKQEVDHLKWYIKEMEKGGPSFGAAGPKHTDQSNKPNRKASGR